MARDGRARARDPRSLPTPAHARHPRRLRAVPRLQPRAATARGALCLARGSLAGHPALRRRVLTDEAHALDGPPRALCAQKVAGELRAPRARARDQGVRRRRRGRRSVGALSRGARAAWSRHARRALAQVARWHWPVAFEGSSRSDAPWTADGQAEGEGAGE